MLSTVSQTCFTPADRLYLTKCYNFTRFAVELNELEDGVAPTDSRHRPDQRLMEQQLWDEANEVKGQLEDKQRTVRRERDRLMEEAAEIGRISYFNCCPKSYFEILIYLKFYFI